MREEARALAIQRDLAALLTLAERDRRTLSALLPLTYHSEGLIRWRAVEALGLAAGRVAARFPDLRHEVYVATAIALAEPMRGYRGATGDRPYNAVGRSGSRGPAAPGRRC